MSFIVRIIEPTIGQTIKVVFTAPKGYRFIRSEISTLNPPYCTAFYSAAIEAQSATRTIDTGIVAKSSGIDKSFLATAIADNAIKASDRKIVRDGRRT